MLKLVFLLFSSILYAQEIERKPLMSVYQHLYGTGAREAEMPLLWGSIGKPPDPFNVPSLDLYLIKPSDFLNGLPLDAEIDWGVDFSLARKAKDPDIYDNAPEGFEWHGFHHGRDPLPIDEQRKIFSDNSKLAVEKLEALYKFALNVYTKGGTVPKENIPARVLADLESLRRGERGVLYVTPPDEPHRTLAMLTQKGENANGLTALEERLMGRGPGQEIPKLSRPPIGPYEFDDNLFVDFGPTRDPLRLVFEGQPVQLQGKRRWIAGGVLDEPKTLMQPGFSRIDALALLQQAYIIHFRFSERDIPGELRSPLLRDPRFQWQVALSFALEERSARESGQLPLIWGTEYSLAPITATKLRYVDLVLEAIDDPKLSNPLFKLYKEVMGFEQIHFLKKDPDLPWLNTGIYRTSAKHFETVTFEKLRERPGGEVVKSGQLLPKYILTKEGKRSVFIHQWPHERAMARRYLRFIKSTDLGREAEARVNALPLGELCSYAISGMAYVPWPRSSVLDRWGLDINEYLKH